MKTTVNPEQNQTGSSWSIWRSVSLLAVSLTTVLTVAACGNKGGDAPPPPPPPVFVPPVTGIGTGNCGSCPAGSTLIASAVGHHANGQVEIALEFFGQGNTGQQPGQLTAYAGQAAAQGTFTMQQASQACGIPAGVYQVTTQTPGVWQAQSFTDIVMVGQGPAQVQLVFTQGGGWIISAAPAARSHDGKQFPYRLQGYLFARGQQGLNWCPIVVY